MTDPQMRANDYEERWEAYFRVPGCLAARWGRSLESTDLSFVHALKKTHMKRSIIVVRASLIHGCSVKPNVSTPGDARESSYRKVLECRHGSVIAVEFVSKGLLNNDRA